MTNPGNRRIDRVLSDDFLAGISERSLEDLRQMRHDAEQEETDLSYLRRMLQGRLDILRAEMSRRSGNGDGSTLVDLLPKILAHDGPAGGPRGLGRHLASEPTSTDQRRRHVEALVSDVELSDLDGQDDADLNRLLGVLEREEAELSARRHAVQAAMDACTAEIARRYREGGADASDLLPSESPS